MNLSDTSLITDETILVFDKDGVLFESEEIKLQVFEDIRQGLNYEIFR